MAISLFTDCSVNFSKLRECLRHFNIVIIFSCIDFCLQNCLIPERNDSVK